jgi:hypothetical protein
MNLVLQRVNDTSGSAVPSKKIPQAAINCKEETQ